MSSIASTTKPREREILRKATIIGWIIELAGMALWFYGYFTTGNPSLVDWGALTPWWIADFLPNIEGEIGMVLVVAGMVPLYWPTPTRALDSARPRGA